MPKILIILCFLLPVVRGISQQTGFASFYADKFVGRKTANGEIYSHQAATAAHKNLPFGTAVKVTNIKNDKSILVKINDRGPFSRRFIIDLSKDAAKALDIFDGSQTVKLEVLGNVADSTIIIPDLVLQLNPLDSTHRLDVATSVDTTKKPVVESSVVAPEEKQSAGIIVKNLYKVLPARVSKADFGIKLGTFESFHKLNAQLSKLSAADQELALVFLSSTKRKNQYTLILGPFEGKAVAKAHPRSNKSNIVSLKNLNK